MKVSCILLLSLLSFGLSAQSLGIGGSSEIVFNLRDGSSNNRSFIRSRLPIGNTVEFNRYMHETPRRTTIVLIKGDTIRGSYMYNMESETLESADGDSLIAWNFVSTFEFEATKDSPKQKFSNLKLVWPESEYGGFIRDLYGSEYVKVKYYLEYIPASWDPSTQMGEKNDKVVAKSDSYLKSGEDWKEIPSGKTAFFDFFGRYSESLRKYARKNKLKHRNPEDVAKMVAWVTKSGN